MLIVSLLQRWYSVFCIPILHLRETYHIKKNQSAILILCLTHPTLVTKNIYNIFYIVFLAIECTTWGVDSFQWRNFTICRICSDKLTFRTFSGDEIKQIFDFQYGDGFSGCISTLGSWKIIIYTRYLSRSKY